MKRVAEMDLAEKQNEGLIFENCTCSTVNNILPDDKANKAFNKIDGNIAGVDWEAETQYLAVHMPHLNNNQYEALAGDGDNEEHNTKSSGVDNDSEMTGVRHDEKITGVDSHNENTGVK